MSTISQKDPQQIMIETAIIAWNNQINQAARLFNSLSDEQLNTQVAPGRNSVFYLMGHLVAVNDRMLGLLGIGERRFAHYDEAFISNADRSGLPVPDATELRKSWKESSELLSEAFAKLTPAEWLTKHTAMTEEDLAKEPTRNRLSVFLNRTSHVANHLGQMNLGNY